MEIKKLRLYAIIATSFFLLKCSSDLMNSIPLIEIDPEFANAGINHVDLISLNESDTYSFTYNRTYGISRELTMNLTIDEEVLNSYNQEKGTNFQLLPAEYYTIPQNVKFDVKSNEVNFDITLSSKKLYKMAGSIEAASQYVLPIKAVSTETVGVNVDESGNTLLVNVNMQSSTVTVSTPSLTNLYFSKDSEIKETFEITGALNFSGISPEAISLVVDDQAPLLNSGDYTLLPEANYSLGVGKTNNDGDVVVEGEISALGLSSETIYLLPCKFQSSNPDYVMVQDEPVYYVVNISDLKISITDANEGEAVSFNYSLATYNSSVNVTSNIVLANELNIDLSYDPSLISTFNTNTSSDYQTLPDGSVSISSSSIAAGSKSVDIPYSIDLSDISLDNKVSYLIPFVINEEVLGQTATVSGSKVIYISVTKSLAGTYNLNVIDNERTRNIQNIIFNAWDVQRASEEGWDAVVASQAQYGFGGDGDWYSVLFSVTDEDMPGVENGKRIEIYTFLELLETTGGTNKVTENNSYFNTVTGEIYIDCYVYESWFAQSYKETYSFTLQ